MPLLCVREEKWKKKQNLRKETFGTKFSHRRLNGKKGKYWDFWENSSESPTQRLSRWAGRGERSEPIMRSCQVNESREYSKFNREKRGAMRCIPKLITRKLAKYCEKYFFLFSKFHRLVHLETKLIFFLSHVIIGTWQLVKRQIIKSIAQCKLRGVPN